jgi:hypothetical protein
MSLVAISGNASGTGTLTIAAPNTNNNYTLNLPAATGTVMVSENMPAFSAGPNATQSISAGTWTKMQYNTEEFDTNSNYDASTNYRFTPTVAGYYQINGCAESTANSASGYFLVAVYKNGSAFKYGQNYKSDTSAGPSASIATLVYFNGSTDYVELYAVGANAWTRGGNLLASYFQASMVRSA